MNYDVRKDQEYVHVCKWSSLLTLILGCGVLNPCLGGWDSSSSKAGMERSSLGVGGGELGSSCAMKGGCIVLPFIYLKILQKKCPL